MKSNARLILSTALAAVLAEPSVHAAVLTWDTVPGVVGPGDGTVTGGIGTWDATTGNWTVDGGLNNIAWINANKDTAVLGGTAGAVALGSSIDTGGLTLNTTGYGITTTGYALNFAATNNTLLFNNIAAATLTGPVGGTGDVILSTSNPATAGTLTLNGSSTGGWSGTTTLNPGMTLALAADNRALAGTSGITFGGGNLTLTNTSATEAGHNRVADGAGITSAGGGTLTWTNTAASGRVYAETIGPVDLVRGQLNFLEATNQGGGGGNSQTLTLSGLTRTGVTNTSAVSFGSNSGLNTTTNIIQISGAGGTGSGSGQIIGPWAFYGTTPASPTDYAVYDASGRVLNASITANNVERTWGPAANITLGATFTALTGTRTLNTLRYSGGAGLLNLGASNNLETYGILNGGSALNIYTTATGGLTTPAGGGHLYLTPGAAAITVSAPVNENGGAVTLVKSGGNTLTLGSTLGNFSGGVVVNAGTLALGANSDANLGAASGGLTFNGTATLGYTDGLVLNASRTVTINAGANVLFSNAIRVDGVLTGSGSFRANTADAFIFLNPDSDFSGTIISETAASTTYGLDMAGIGDGPGAGLINLNNGTFRWIRTVGGPTTFSNRQFALSGTTGAGVISSMGSQTLTIAKDLLVTGVGNKTLTLAGTNAGVNVFAGNIANGANGGTSVIGLTKSEGGTWALSGTNTYSGDTNLTAAFGLLIFQGRQSLSPNTTLKFAQASSSVHAARFLDDGAGTINFNRPIEHGGTNTSQVLSLFVGNNNTANGGGSSGTTTGSTIQVGNITHTSLAGDTGTWTLNVTGANGYRLQTGTITLNNLTARTAAQTTTYILNPTSANMTVAAVTMATGNITAADGIPVLRLGGSSSENIVTGAISNAPDFATGHALNLEKQGASTWTLQGANTYTGTTAISGGKLLLGSTGSLAAGSAVTVSGGAIGGTGTVNGAVTVSSTGGIDLRDGAIGTLTLASTLDITGGAGANLISFDLGNGTGTSDQLSVAGTTTVTTPGAAVIQLNPLGGAAGATNGTYTLIGGAGALDAANFANFSLATTAAFGKTYGLVHDSGTENGNLQVTVASATAATPAAFWAGGGNNWSTPGNWRASLSGDDAVAGAPDYQTNVSFSTTTPSPANLTTNVLDVDFNINSLTFTNASGNVMIGGTKMLTIEATNANGNTAGNGIDSQKTSGTNTISAKVGLGSSQTWTVATGGTLSVSGAITDFGGGYGLTKAGGGTLTLTGANTFSGPLVMNAGTLGLGGSPAAGFGNPSSLTFAGTSTIAHTGSSVTLTLPAVQIDPGVTATFDKGGAGGGGTFTFDGALTGSGTLSFASGGSGNGTFNLNKAGSFTGTVRTSSYATNGSTSLNFASLGDAATITHGGTAVDLNVNYTGNADLTFNTRQIVMASSRGIAVSNNGVGSLVINPALSVTAAGAKTLSLGGTNTLPTNTFGGLIADGTGAAIALTKSGTGAWTVSNSNNSYTGATTISGGVLSVSTLADAGSNSSIGAYATPGAAGLVLSGGTLLYTGGSVTTNRGFTQSTGSGINIGGASAASLTFGDSSVSGNGTLLTLTGTPGSTLTISGAVNNNTTASNGWNIDPRIDLTISGVMSGTGGISRRNGSGNVTLNNDSNSFTGLVNTNANAGSGALFFTSIADYGTNSALGRGTAGVAIVLGGNQGGAAPLTFIGSSSQTSNRQFDLGASASIVNNGAGSLTFTGLATDSNKFIRANQTSGARTLTLGGTYTGGANLISGNIDNNGGTATVAIAKDGPGNWTLSGTNTYTGSTVVNAGTLQFPRMASLYNADSLSWTPAKINVKAGATLALNVDSGGTAGFDAASLSTLLTNISVAGSATAGLQAGANLGFDTGTATGGTFTQGNAIGNSTGAGGGAIGLAKLGAGTLVLDKSNTYTGNTIVSQGTLIIAGSTATTGYIEVAAGATLGGGGSGGSATLIGDAVLSPGNPSSGDSNLFNLESLTLSASSVYHFEPGAPHNDYYYNPFVFSDTDHVNVNGPVTLDGSLRVANRPHDPSYDLSSVSAGDRWLIMTYSGLFTDNTLEVDPASAPLPAGLIYTVDTSQSGYVFLQVAVPEAGTAVLFGLGGLLLRLMRRRATRA